MNSYSHTTPPVGNGQYSSVGNGSAVSSPSNARSSERAGSGNKRGLSAAGVQSSAEEDDNDGDDRRKQAGVKRACNECRQQKLRCDVIAEPTFKPCTRCLRLKLECLIDANFKRVGKRYKTAQMEREIMELRNRLAAQDTQPQTLPVETRQTAPASDGAGTPTGMYTGLPNIQDQYSGSQEAVASLLDLKQGLDGTGNYGAVSTSRVLKSLEDVLLHQDRIRELFNIFWVYYHPFLPFLDSSKSPDHYFSLSPLLFWTVVTVAARKYTDDATLSTGLAGPLSRLLWSTVSGVPQNYHVVKALCLLCTWPLPTSSTSSDPTFIICGIMMQTALQIGLHRPSHAQDFSRYRIELREEDIRDRLRTWAACTVVAQSVFTCSGQPPTTVYDGCLLLAVQQGECSNLLSQELKNRLRIEMFCDKVTRALYADKADPGEGRDSLDSTLIAKLLAQDYHELDSSIRAQASAIDTLHLRAAGLHLHLYAFFESSSSENYRRALVDLYLAARNFLDCALDLETNAGCVLPYATAYLMHIILAAGFTLLKLLNSFFASLVPVDDGKALFNRTIWAVRQMSVTNNDLPQRLAEVLAQLWRGSGAGIRPLDAKAGAVDGSLQLKIRCRMSMSLVFDSVWRWRDKFEGRGPRGNLDSAVNDPTNPDSAAESSANSVAGVGADPTLSSFVGGAMNMTDGTSYEVFDPLNWVLDGFVDFPYSQQAVHGLEAQGLLPSGSGGLV